jgi:hypothetical protein
MRALIQKKLLILAIPAALLCVSASPGLLLADDEKDKDTPPANAAPAKTAAPAAGLTERERMLLDRVEQLEKRVTELEAKEPVSAPPAVLAGRTETSVAAAAGAPGTNPVAVTAASPASPSILKSASAIAPGIGPAASPSQDQTTPTNVAAVGTTGKPGYIEPFSDADWTWLNGSPRTKEIFWDSKFFTPEIRVDTNYVADFNHPTDHSIGGSSELFRSYEVQLEQFGVGGDFHFDNVRGRLMTQFGMYS